MTTMKRVWLTFSLLLISCATAGVSEEVLQPTNSLGSQATISGYSLLKDAFVDVYDYDDPTTPIHLVTLKTDDEGFFEFTPTTTPKLFLFVASDGHYTDPLNLNSVPSQDTLSSIIKTGQTSVEISFMTDLFVSLTECLTEQSGYGANAYLFAKSILGDFFNVDPFESQDSTINNTSTADPVWTGLNLAYFKMAKDHDAVSGLALFKIFSSNIHDTCTLITSDDQKSKNYIFENESFRGDYLNALLGLALDSAVSGEVKETNFSELVEYIRGSKHFLFGMGIYDED